VGILWRGYLGRENRNGDEAKQQRKSNNGRWIAKNPVERKFELAQSGMGVSCRQVNPFFAYFANNKFDTTGT
jgi:hypothetical protein